MAKTVRLICAGILPLILGFLLNWVLLVLPIPGFILIVQSFLLLFAWGYLAFKLSNSARNSIIQALLMCSFGFFMLILVLYQELVMKAYWGNIIGFGTQMFFLPWVTLASLLMSPFLDVITVWPMYIAIWVALFIASCIGCFLEQQK